MRVAILALIGAALVGCDYIPAMPGAGRGTVASTNVTARRAEFIAVVEAAGCRLDQSDNEAVLGPAGFTDAEAGALGGILLSEGVAELSNGDLILVTENCV